MEDNGIWERLARAQASMKNPKLDKVNPRFHSKYASLASVLDAIRPALNNEGVFLTQYITEHDGRYRLTTEARSGSDLAILDTRPVDITGNSQADGSAETYAKRYSLCSAFALVGEEDDDGNAAVDVQGQRKAQKQPQAVPASKEQLEGLDEAVTAFADITSRTRSEVYAALGKNGRMNALGWERGDMTAEQALTAHQIINGWIQAKKD